MSDRCSRRPRKPRQEAVDNDVHVVGVSSLAGGHLTLMPQLKQALVERGRGDILIIAGGVIPPQDYDELYANGIDAIFGPGTVISESAAKILDVLLARITGQGGVTPVKTTRNGDERQLGTETRPHRAVPRPPRHDAGRLSGRASSRAIAAVLARAITLIESLAARSPGDGARAAQLGCCRMPGNRSGSA